MKPVFLLHSYIYLVSLVLCVGNVKFATLAKRNSGRVIACSSRACVDGTGIES
jgi:hypothetical protein